MMKFSSLLTYYRERSGLTKTDLKNRIGVTMTYVINLENGKQKPPTIDRCLQICEALKLPGSDKEKLIDLAVQERMDPDVVTWMESKIKVQMVPVISWVKANRFAGIHDPLPSGIGDEFLPALRKGENVFYLKIKNECMVNPKGNPSFQEGGYILVDPNASVNDGDFAVVADRENNEATFKQYRRQGKAVVLHPLNPKYSDIELDHGNRFEIVGKVVGYYNKV